MRQKAAHRPPRLVRQLARVVKLCDDIDLLFACVIAQQRQKFGIFADSLGQHHGQPCAKTYHAHMLDFAQHPEKMRNDRVAVEQRVAARNEHIGDFGVIRNIRGHRLELLDGFFFRQADHAPAEAVAAVHGAAAGRQHHSRLAVLVLQAFELGVFPFAAGVKSPFFPQLIF